MFETADNSSAREPEPVSRVRHHPAILRASSLVVASVLSPLMITTVVPPIVADQSDRAVSGRRHDRAWEVVSHMT
jgi:hypothetical protein